MQQYGRASINLLRRLPRRGGHDWPNGFWGQGTQEGRNGYLFGETPPPPGESRKWESWELPTYLGLGIATISGLLIAFGKTGESTGISEWAQPRALKELEEEDKIFAELEDATTRSEVLAHMSALGKPFDEYYDLVMARKELEVLKKQGSL